MQVWTWCSCGRRGLGISSSNPAGASYWPARSSGEGGASTVALLLPCAEMVRDTREDDTVDVSVGTAFGDLNPVRAARDALDQLSGPSAGTGDTATAPGPPPTVDPGVLAEARSRTC